MSEVAKSIQHLAEGLGPSLAVPSTATPERKTAIRLLEEDGELSENEQIQAMRLFRKDSSIAQSYISIRNKSTRTKYIQAEMEDM